MTRIKDNGTKLILEQWDMKVTVEVPRSDTTIDELLGLVKGVIVGSGYSERMFNRAIMEYVVENELDLEDGGDEIPEEMLDAAFAEHNAHEEGFDMDFDNTYKAEE